MAGSTLKSLSFDVGLGVLVGGLAVAWAWTPSYVAAVTDDIATEGMEPCHGIGHVILAPPVTVALPFIAWAAYGAMLHLGCSRWPPSPGLRRHAPRALA